MTLLFSLDIRGNFELTPVVPGGLLLNLINLRTLQIEGQQSSFESSRNLLEATRSVKSFRFFCVFQWQYKIRYSDTISIHKSHFPRI